MIDPLSAGEPESKGAKEQVTAPVEMGKEPSPEPAGAEQPPQTQAQRKDFSTIRPAFDFGGSYLSK